MRIGAELPMRARSSCLRAPCRDLGRAPEAPYTEVVANSLISVESEVYKGPPRSSAREKLDE